MTFTAPKHPLRQPLTYSALASLLLWQGYAPGALASPMLEEVLVTAEKREESLQDVPISIAAFNENTLEKMGVFDIKGLASKVPNVVITEFPGSATTVRLFIRGVGQSDVQVTQDPSVALYMDGVYIGSSVGTAFETADISRIEVLRGPQGTLYGRNATGGAINIITNKADPEAIHFKQRLSFGNYDAFRSRTIANFPLSDAAAIKLAYSHSSRDGIVENLGAGKDWGIEKRNNFTADFRWLASDDVTLDYKFERANVKDTSRLSQSLGFDPSAPSATFIAFANSATDANGIPVEVSKDRLSKATAFDEEVPGDITIDGHTLDIGWDINDNLSLRSITGYRELDAYNQTAQSPTTSIFNTYSITNGITDTTFEQFSQEIQLLGSSDQWTWVGGIYYYRDEGEELNTGNSNGSENLPAGSIVDLTTTENTSLALFGQATWTPASADRWHITVGARYSDDNRKGYRNNNRVSFAFGGAPSPIPAFIANYDKDFDQFNPSLTVEYDLNDNSNVYAKAITAYKSGGTSQRSTSLDNFSEGFDPEDLVSWELGYKGDLLDSRMRLNAALFYMEFEGYQQSVQTGRSPGERDFVNIKDAEIYGLELDITFAITDALTTNLSYGYLDTGFGPETMTYTRINDSTATGFELFTETLTDDIALAPEHSLTASLDYNMPVSWGTINANMNYQYQDKSLTGVQFPTGEMNSRGVLNATLSASDIAIGSNGNLRITLWANNITDDEYLIVNTRQEAFDSLGFVGGLGTFGDPRTYGITFEYEYE